LVLALLGGVFAIAAWQPAFDPIAPPAAASFDPDLVKRGAELAAIGDCGVCHTTAAGRAFAGGRAIPTPFGAIYSTNITPDPETGIGRWSEAAFQRALRRGVRRDGAYLYPAFPYDHFTLVSDDDDKALYAFLMTRQPVRAAAPDNELPFPLNVRLVLFGWDSLFLRPGPYHADSAHDDTWNRGAYFAEGLGHCGACHTPRNLLGAEKTDEKFAGGVAEGWTAYALDASSPAPVPWNAEALSQYLGHSFADDHGVARGPMADVANDLRSVPENDVRAIATYVAAQMGHRDATGAKTAQQVDSQSQRGKAMTASNADSQADTLRIDDTKGEGAVIFAGACAGCHEGPRAMPYGGIDLALSSGISGPSADNLINIVLYGLPAAEAAHAPIMPGFANAMNDAQLAALVRYLRGHFSDRGPWSDIEKSVREARSGTRAATINQAPANQPAPAGTMQRTTHEAQR
jgi:mono/diheme cytochrome c family protein